MSAIKCLGTDCPVCTAARRHYIASGCLIPGCTDPHAEAQP